FRSVDVQMGGQGAPLAPFFHHACARFAGLDAPVAFLNLGGVGNLTWVDPAVDRPELPGGLMAFDTGPANAPLNDLMLVRRGVAQDHAGALAASGTVDERVVAAFLAHPYFLKMPPKSLDRNDFPALLSAVAHLSDADAAATLTACTAAAVAKGAEHFPHPVTRVLVCGGGRHNAAMMAALCAHTGLDVEPVEAIGLNGDMLEAQAFAFLAVRVIRGLPTSAPATTGVPAAVGGGQISRP
ncbi:MAG: anhydro-N-acetylmuramic acid kinase, partial [Paracoccaceae bacterium]